jgi:hypothetical protein
MNVPTVNEYPARNQLSTPESSIPKLFPIISSGDRQTPTFVWVMNWAMQTIVMNNASLRGENVSEIERAVDTGFRLGLSSMAKGAIFVAGTVSSRERLLCRG